MPNNFFISGMPKTGKTSILRNFVKKLESKGYCVGGFISPAIKEHGTREGFYVEDIATGKTALLASLSGDGPKVSKYSVDVASFEGIALDCLRKDNLKKCDVIIIDEIGRMELESEKFADALENVLNGPTPVIASLHRDFVSKYSFLGKVYNLTQINRNAIEIGVFDNVLQVLESPRPKESKEVKEEFVEKKKIEKEERQLTQKIQKPTKQRKEVVTEKKEDKKEVKKEQKKAVKEKVEKRIEEKPKKDRVKETKKIEKESEMEIEETEPIKESIKEPRREEKIKEEKKPEKKESIWDKLKNVFKR